MTETYWCEYCLVNGPVSNCLACIKQMEAKRVEWGALKGEPYKARMGIDE